MDQLLQDALACGKQFVHLGKPADYIPALAKANGNRLGIAVVTTDNQTFCCGDCDDRFTIQSIGKVIVLALALEDCGEDVVFTKVGVEPTGDAFNSILRLDQLDHIRPYNPLINAGAIATITNIRGEDGEHRFTRLLQYARLLCGNPGLDYDQEVYRSEKATGDRNRALAYLMKSHRIFFGDVEEHLDVYFKMCSLRVTCREIAHMGAVLADGCLPETGERVITPRVLKIVRTLMTTCGMYDASGKFAVRVGLPAKSGVGGGIVATVPGRFGIGVYGPALDKKGNSVAGIEMLQYLSDQMDLSIFGAGPYNGLNISGDGQN